jgi:hypothetical protein
VGRVGALPAAPLDQAEVAEPLQQEVQEQALGPAGD